MGIRKTSFDEHGWNIWVAKSLDRKRSWLVYEKCGWTIQEIEGLDGKRAWLIAAPDAWLIAAPEGSNSYLHMTNDGLSEAMDMADMRIREQEKANDQP